MPQQKSELKDPASYELLKLSLIINESIDAIAIKRIYIFIVTVTIRLKVKSKCNQIKKTYMFFNKKLKRSNVKDFLKIA